MGEVGAAGSADMAGAVIAATGAGAMSSVQTGLLKQALQGEQQMQAELLRGMLQANPAGVGGSVNTWA